MRIVYGLQGYGRGHATRVAAVLPALQEKHQVMVMAGGDAFELLSPNFEVERIPMVGYEYTESGEIDVLATLNVCLRRVIGIIRHGSEFMEVVERIRRFQPDVIISDAEIFTHRAARLLKIPRIGFDHFGVMIYGKPRLDLRDRLMSKREIDAYKLMMGRPNRIITSSFYPVYSSEANIEHVGPLLREEVAQKAPSDAGHLLVYFNNGDSLLQPHVVQALEQQQRRVVFYGSSRRGQHGNILYKAPSSDTFLEDLASCHALISTAGNQLVGEALHFGKPMLVVPEDSVEQRMNATEVVAMGLGLRCHLEDFSTDRINALLQQREVFIRNGKTQRQDGREQALQILEAFLGELVGTTPPKETEPSLVATVLGMLPHIAASQLLATLAKIKRELGSPIEDRLPLSRQ